MSQRPVRTTVPTTGQCCSVEVLSAVAAGCHLHFLLHEGRAMAEVVADFLVRLLHDAHRPAFLIFDGHSIHKVPIVREFVEAKGDGSWCSSCHPTLPTLPR
jgi:hypothetical protein